MIALRPYQQRVVDYFAGGGKRAILVAHRRCGKDVLALHHVYRAACERVGVYWYALPSYSQGKKVIWLGKFSGEPLLEAVIPSAAIDSKNETEMRITLRNGSLIQFIGSDRHAALVGSNPVGLVFSEYALADPLAWSYLRPILSENGGWALWISTPRGRNDLFRIFEIARQNPSWFCEKLDIFATGVLDPSILEMERREGMPEQLLRSEYLVDWDSGTVGSVYGPLLEEASARGGVTTWETTGTADVFTAWDVGFADSTAIWFWTVTDGRVDVIDHYESNGKALSHYFDVVKSKGYTYRQHWLPHDSRARNFQSGVSTVELAREALGRRVAALPILPIQQGLEAGRWLLQQPIRFHETNCQRGLEALREYRYAYDEGTKTFSDRPEHSVWSHSADAYRYLATAVRGSIRRMSPDPVEAKKDAPTGFYPIALERLFEDHEKDRGPRKRIA